MRPRVPCAFLLVASLIQVPAAAAGLRPLELTCEHRVDPIGLGEKVPRLSWKLEATDPSERDLHQTSYQILVASSPALLNFGSVGIIYAHDLPLRVSYPVDLWNSGRVNSDQTSEIEYAGKVLSSRQQCWWMVRVWDQDGAVSAWSQPAHWTMALLRPGEWQAQWIGFDPAPPTGLDDLEHAGFGGQSWAQAPLPASRTLPRTAYFRRGFSIPSDRKLTRATLIFNPDDLAAVSVNGQPAGDESRWEPASALDITALVHEGDNAVIIKVTQEDGYAPSLLGRLELDFTDGAVIRMPIDYNWRYALPAADGNAPDFSEKAWPHAVLIPGQASPWQTPTNAWHFLPPPAILQKSFAVSKPVRRATLYATALGAYEADLNGVRVGKDYFTPGWTDYRYRVQYQTYDVSSLIHTGANTLGALLGDGWYAGVGAFTGRRQIYGGFPRFAGQLEIDFTDGTRQTIATDSSWQATTGPIRYADLYMGTATDLRRGLGAWSPVAVGQRQVPGNPYLLEPNFILQPTTVDPVRISDELPAVKVTEPQPGTYVIDFGQNLVGWVRLRAGGKRGQKVVVRHGEMLNPNGTAYTSNLRGADATDVYRLKGSGEETLEPHFTIHGFRYAEITGLDDAPTLDAATAIVVGSLLRRTGGFSCSSPLVNQLYHNIIWGQKGNYLEAPTDCPQRDERLGWTGDTQFFIPTAAYNFDVTSFMERWLTTMTDDQGQDGTFPMVAPATTMQPGGATAWGDADLVCTYALWHAYGDTRIIVRRFDSMDRYIKWLQVWQQSGILSVNGPEDWVNLGGGSNSDVTDTAYGAYLCGIMAEMARAIGRPQDADRYTATRARFVKAFQDNFVQPDGHIWDSSQTAFALAFTMDLLPDSMKAKAAGQFVDDIASHNWHLGTGFIGTPRLLPALEKAGRNDVAYRLLLQDTYPSWLYQVRLGATTMWERWDGWTPDNGFQAIAMNSFNHYAFGAVGQFLYQYVLGIDSDGPGYRHILIHPRIGAGLTAVHGSYDSASGRITSAWKTDNGIFTLDATIPPNTTATVTLPSGQSYNVGSGNYRYSEVFHPH